MKKLLAAALFTFLAASIFAESRNLILKDSYNADIKNLNIELHSETVSIKEIYGSEIVIEVYSNNKKNMPVIDLSKNTLSIASNSRPVRIGEYCKVEISIPQDKKFKTVKLVTSSGDVEISTIAGDNVLIESSSGSLEADSITADYKLVLKKSSGDIDVKTLASDELKLSTSSGSIKVEKINTIDSDIETTSGSIKIEKLDTESFDLKSTSGSIKVSRISADYYSVHSTSGSVNLEFLNAPSASSDIKTSSGSVKLYFLSKEGFNTKVSTSSGSFSDGINGNRFSSRVEATSTYYGGGSTINISTTSGSVSIDK